MLYKNHKTVFKMYKKYNNEINNNNIIIKNNIVNINSALLLYLKETNFPLFSEILLSDINRKRTYEYINDKKKITFKMFV